MKPLREIRLLPEHIGSIAPKMPVAGDGGKHGAFQPEKIDDGGGSEICMRGKQREQNLFFNLFGSEGFNEKGSGLRKADGIAELNFAGFCKISCYDVFRQIPGEIGTAAIDL